MNVRTKQKFKALGVVNNFVVKLEDTKLSEEMADKSRDYIDLGSFANHTRGMYLDVDMSHDNFCICNNVPKVGDYDLEQVKKD